MRVSQTEKEQSRKRIVASASRMLREDGIEGASLGDIMKDAGMTHGGFYRHFADKNALVETALDEAFDQLLGPLEAALDQESATVARDRFRNFYLSDHHRTQPGEGCPAAALGSEIARADESIRARFGAGLRKMISTLARTHNGNNADRDTAAIRELTLLVGAVTLARACDAHTGDAILDACRSTTK